jgi:hypothetical protein
MKNPTSRHWSTFLLVSIALCGMIGISAILATAQSLELSPQVLDQIQALEEEKAARTPAQRKISSRLLYGLKMHRGQPIARGVPTLRSDIAIAPDGTVLVDINAQVTDAVLRQIKALGGEVLSSFPRYSAIRARLPVTRMETLANLPEVKSIRPADEATTNKLSPPQPASLPEDRGSFLPRNVRPSRAEREAQVRAQLREALPRLAQTRTGNALADGPITNVVNTSQGDVAHRAALARSTFGVDGSGIRIGVLSDGVDTLAARQASGDLPPIVTVLAGQAGSGDEGTAMLEIVYDLAPGAQLFFATAFNGQASFAQNILDLQTAGCDIIVDDVFYFAEPVFQDGIIAQAVNTVTTAGALYFSSAGNSGNKNDNTSGVWEGDFVAIAAPGVIGGTAHNFGGGVNSNQITVDSLSLFTLQWSDASGGSANDYDLYLLNAALTTVLNASTSSQTGTQNPFEAIDSGAFNDVGNRLVIIQFSGAARYLHLNANRGRLNLNTSGQTSGHAAAVDAFGVAAVDVATAGGGAFVGGATNPVETYSSDGLRRVFYTENGTAITPGNFSATGGAVRQKPDIAAADCVATATPNFNPFCGTSAAAPHAAAIAALLLEANPSLVTAGVRSIFSTSSRDIEVGGVDRDSGVGIVDAFLAVSSQCSNALTPLNKTMGSSGGAGNVANVTTASGCPWTAVSNVPWITVTGGSTGTGNGTVTYTVGANPGPNPRRGTMTIAGKTFIVSQATPVPAPCTITIPPGATVGGGAGAANFAVTASTGSCAWATRSHVSWITITSGASGTGSGTVQYTVTANPGPGSRAGRITVNGKRYTVTQTP